MSHLNITALVAGSTVPAPADADAGVGHIADKVVEYPDISLVVYADGAVAEYLTAHSCDHIVLDGDISADVDAITLHLVTGVSYSHRNG